MTNQRDQTKNTTKPQKEKQGQHLLAFSIYLSIHPSAPGAK